MPVVAAASTALPEHRYEQADVTEAFAELLIQRAGASSAVRDVVRRTHEATEVKARHLVLSLPEYEPLDDFGKANDVFLREAPLLAARAVDQALQQAGLRGTDVDLIVSTTVTGVAVPSVDARLVPLVGLRTDVRRLPIMGLGCVAGASGVARVADYLHGHPDAVAVLISVELCSLTLQHDDASMANIVASGLFGDGAAAVVMVGEQKAEQLGIKGPRVFGSHSHFFADTERVMGWDVGSSGLRVVLSPEVPQIVASEMSSVVPRLLDPHGLTIDDVGVWVAHSGGPKVLLALQDALALSPEATALTWESLREVGNLSSASVLDVLARTMRSRPSVAGDTGVMVAMGPGFCAELVLMQW
ncbi:MAG TPA: 3-oxoacyl-[acyl-carrier-protein] synthase III C-terminal domain-containing protein [Actinomycetes bacterium]|nr:3-oxoacyl-[acyl-carrier-protein] synthase III C-terminal domain-containing protein [Actinomycetes bacterium]